MEYKELGNSGIKVSRICFGCAPMGGYDYGNVNDKDSIRAVHKAIDMGINFFDTADVYGFGHSEKILGKSLGTKRKDVVIASKVGLKWDENGKITRDCSSKRIFEALENSLRRLKVDAITLYQIHWPDPETPAEETIEALLACQKAGKIKHIGCSNFGKDLIEKFQNSARLESLQASYNLLDRSAEKGLLSCCKNLGMAFFAHSSLARGYLSGKYNIDHKFIGSDTRKNSEYFSNVNLEKKKQISCNIQKIAAKYDKIDSSIAIRWILDNPLVTGAIVGIKNVYQLKDCLKAFGWELSREDFDTL